MTDPIDPAPAALFAGLCTLDVIQLVERLPASNEKVTAVAQTVAAGGPATNAAATFAHLGGAATLVTCVGAHPLTAGIRADLDALGVRVVDLAPGQTGSPSVSSVIVTARTGARAVVSTNGTLPHPPGPDLDELLNRVQVVQVDGHYPAVARSAVTAARRRGLPTVADAGSWKPTMPELLPMLDVVVCSADFHPPGVTTVYGAAAYLVDRGVRWVAVTQGGDPVLQWRDGGLIELPVPRGPVVDTLAAGDVFHGGVTFGVARRWPLTDDAFTEVLTGAAAVATRSCGAFGTRAWMSPRHGR